MCLRRCRSRAAQETLRAGCTCSGEMSHLTKNKFSKVSALVHLLYKVTVERIFENYRGFSKKLLSFFCENCRGRMREYYRTRPLQFSNMSHVTQNSQNKKQSEPKIYVLCIHKSHYHYTGDFFFLKKEIL